MQRSPGAWHPSVRIATRGSAAAVEHRRASLLAWLEKYRPQLASDGFDGETLNALGVNKDGWRAWPTIARCAGGLGEGGMPHSQGDPNICCQLSSR